jgi:succinoglycan biosynthesis protein ExoW
MHKKVSVITPFFQRQPGLLRKAIESVAAQKNVSAKVEVVVVDDGSPTTAESEVEGWRCRQT